MGLFGHSGGGAVVLGKLLVRGILLIWLVLGQGPIALAFSAGGSCLDIFSSREPKGPGELIV